MSRNGQGIEVVASTDDGVRAIFTIDWCVGDLGVVRFLLTSDEEGVALHFGPTTAVAAWPAWLRATAIFAADGGQATIRLDPLEVIGSSVGITSAFSLRGRRVRGDLAALADDVAHALRGRCLKPSPNEQQAIDSCAGLALALVDLVGIAPTAARHPALFRPGPIPIVIDDINDDPVRQHVRLTYRLPRLGGRWTDACSLRLFRSEQAFGVELRALPGDYLPASLRSTCVHDDLGPLMRLSINRAGQGVEFVGVTSAVAALRLICAFTRQIARDLTSQSGPIPIPGFAEPQWRHWLPALPDLLATQAAEPLDVTR